MRSYGARATLAIFLFVLAKPAVTATSGASPRSEATDRQASSSIPDLSGVWVVREFVQNILPKEDPPFQPWAEELYKKRLAEKNATTDPDSGPDPTARCIPPGIPRLMLHPFPMEIVQAPSRVLMIFEYQALTREIYIDGRPHPKDLDPTYMGNAIGHYEGATLVVDTVGFNDKTWLDLKGLPHTDALHVTERIHRVSHDALEDDYTIDDPKAYTKPWTAQKIFKLEPNWQIQEFVCMENNEYH